jgi:hypothetical protein
MSNGRRVSDAIIEDEKENDDASSVSSLYSNRRLSEESMVAELSERNESMVGDLVFAVSPKKGRSESIVSGLSGMSGFTGLTTATSISTASRFSNRTTASTWSSGTSGTTHTFKSAVASGSMMGKPEADDESDDPGDPDSADVALAALPEEDVRKAEQMIRENPSRTTLEDLSSISEDFSQLSVANLMAVMRSEIFAQQYTVQLEEIAEEDESGEFPYPPDENPLSDAMLSNPELVPTMVSAQALQQNPVLMRAMVEELVKMSNGGTGLVQCTCPPGGPHSCMSPSESVLTSIVASLATSLNASHAATRVPSRRGSDGGPLIDLIKSLVASQMASVEQSTHESRRGSVEAGDRRKSKKGKSADALPDMQDDRTRRSSQKGGGWWQKANESARNNAGTFTIPSNMQVPYDERPLEMDLTLGEPIEVLHNPSALAKVAPTERTPERKSPVDANSVASEDELHVSISAHTAGEWKPRTSSEHEAGMKKGCPCVSSEWLRANINDPSLEVIDVRGRDFAGGHIVKCRNMRVSEVTRDPAWFLADAKARGISHVVFTCMYSVMRAPHCAKGVMSAKSGKAPRISVLEGGVHGWMNACVHDRDTYVRSFDPEFWMAAPANISEGGLVHVMDVIWSSKGHLQLVNALKELAVETEQDDGESP